MKVLVCALFYGDYPRYHRRMLFGNTSAGYGLCETLPQEVPARIWCNQLGKESKEMFRSVDHKGRDWTVTYSPKNVPKYHVMREFWADIRDGSADFDVVVWMDDDIRIYRHAWLAQTINYIEQKGLDPRRIYMGRGYDCHQHENRMAWLKTRPWFEGKTPPLFRSAIGCCFWIGTDVIRMLGLPDPELNHNSADNPIGVEGDWVIGLGAVQRGIPFLEYGCGVKIEGEPRRGIGAK